MKKIGFISIVLVVCMVCACNDTLDIQQKYSFDLQTMPVPKRIIQGETVEIRCQIVKTGYYAGNVFHIRFFQTDGKGELVLDDGRILKPNDLYLLKKEVFRLYYTSHCTDSQTVDVYIEDSFGQVVRKSFSFSNENEKKEE